MKEYARYNLVKYNLSYEHCYKLNENIMENILVNGRKNNGDFCEEFSKKRIEKVRDFMDYNL